MATRTRTRQTVDAADVAKLFNVAVDDTATVAPKARRSRKAAVTVDVDAKARAAELRKARAAERKAEAEAQAEAERIAAEAAERSAKFARGAHTYEEDYELLKVEATKAGIGKIGVRSLRVSPKVQEALAVMAETGVYHDGSKITAAQRKLARVLVAELATRNTRGKQGYKQMRADAAGRELIIRIQAERTVSRGKRAVDIDALKAAAPKASASA